MMKNILVVTDFSEASQNAGRYAVELAKHFNANVVLFHAYQVPVQIPESYFFYTPEDVCGSAMELLAQESQQINPGNKVNLELSCIEGLASDAIVAEARLRKADVIVCAMKGVAKAFRKIFGSTTSALIHKSDIPLIVVPEKAVFNIPNNIALASDLDPETSASTLELLKVIGEKFTSGLSVVWVVGEDFDAENEMRYRPSEFIKGLRGLNPVFEFPKGGSVTKVLEDFIRKNSVAMLAMIPHKHDFMERFFTESITKKMIFHSDIPLLVLPQKKILKGNEELVNDVSEIKNE